MHTEVTPAYEVDSDRLGVAQSSLIVLVRHQPYASKETHSKARDEPRAFE